MLMLISPNRRRTVEVMDGDTEALWAWLSKGFTVHERLLIPAEEVAAEPEPVVEELPVETPDPEAQRGSTDTGKARRQAAKTTRQRDAD